MPRTDEQEVTLIQAELEKFGYQPLWAEDGLSGYRSATGRMTVWANAGWTHFGRSGRLKASGNGIDNLRKHLRADKEGQRSAWSI